MTTRQDRLTIGIAILAFILVSAHAPPGWPAGGDNVIHVDHLPRITPDYAGIVVPPNIAPLNFRIQESGGRFAVEARVGTDHAVSVTSGQPVIQFPERPWRQLLEAGRGHELTFEVRAQDSAGQWTQFAPITNTIAEEDLDPYLAYRLTTPLHNKYVKIGLYQRHLEGFDETCILDNRMLPGTCINCHTFKNADPETMLFHIRSSQHGVSMVLGQSGTTKKVHTITDFNKSPAAYSSWHPSRPIVASSVNKLSLFFHTIGEPRDVFDSRSDIIVYYADSNTVSTAPGISDPNRLETFPAWSSDGRHLYFSSAPTMPFEKFREIRYDLMRIPFEPDSKTWGEPEVVLASTEVGQSILEPRPSPDGRFVLVTMTDSGNFPVYMAGADLYLVDLERKTCRRLECNSDQPESWHSWSTNSRWIVFSSKRRDGLFAQPHFSYISQEGIDHKAFVLPQKDPGFYDSCLNTYAVPEFVTGPVAISEAQFIQTVRSTSEALSAELDPVVRTYLDALATSPRALAGSAPGWDHQD